MGLGAVGVAASAPAPVDVGRPSGAARFTNTQSRGRVSRGSRDPSLEAVVRQPSYFSSQMLNASVNGVSVGPVSLDKTHPSMTGISSVL